MEKLPDEVLSHIYRFLRPVKPTPTARALKRFVQEGNLTEEDFLKADVRRLHFTELEREWLEALY